MEMKSYWVRLFLFSVAMEETGLAKLCSICVARVVMKTARVEHLEYQEDGEETVLRGERTGL